HVHEDSQLQEPDGHNLKLLWADFLESLDGGRTPVASIERAHRSSVLPLLGMISLRTGRSIAWDGAKEEIVGDAEASALLRRPYRGPWVYPT
ncbi:MAG TPA: gfo/Idh/MocA family oxidoreductase, partial [Planctomycetota bacterium]|nr:gfo/Idh/MocA family oxidoreductase [Planctomycetota bacterium]